DERFLRGDARLDFGAVDYWCQVFVNGSLVGEHEGGYIPFAFLIGHLLHPGQNTLTVRVYDSTETGTVTDRWPDFESRIKAGTGGPPFDAFHIPHGKQEWYI